MKPGTKEKNFFSMQHLGDIFLFTNIQRRSTIVQYWKIEKNDPNYKVWKEKEDWDNPLNTIWWQNTRKELHSQKIAIQQGPNILRWGYLTKGMYIVIETYKLVSKEPQEGRISLWRKIWKENLWLNISQFIWLTCRRRILTWNQLRKRGATTSLSVSFSDYEDRTWITF